MKLPIDSFGTSLIKLRKSNIDEASLKYFTNYFYVAIKEKVIPNKLVLEDLIDNALMFASKIEFYDENSKIYQEKGKDVKGYRCSDTKTIFIRNDLKEPLREITVYHELHHAVQTNPKNNMVGINQKSNVGRLVMEAQTQYFAELVYQTIHGVKFESRPIPTENLRMLKGGTVVSNLHNYEMYDNLLNKLAIILNVPKNYFVSINYLNKNNEGLNDLEKKYNEVKEKQKLPSKFIDFLLTYDYIYCVDLTAYINNKDKEIILSEQETDAYEIYPNLGFKLSLKYQYGYLKGIDINYFLALYQNGGNYREFAKHIVDDKTRKIVKQQIEKAEQQVEISKNK